MLAARPSHNGGGLDSMSPRTNRDLAIRILQQGGAMVTNMAPGTTPYRGIL